MNKPSDYGLWMSVAERAAREAGKLMLERLREPLDLRSKGFRDVVTAVDFEAQALITNAIRAAFPEHAFVTEEEDNSLPRHGSIQWIIDPIDGTSNYSRGIPNFCTSIGVADQNEVVAGVIYDPNLNELFCAVKGEGAKLNGQPVSCSSAGSLEDAVVGLDWSRELADRQQVLKVLATFGVDVRTLRAPGSAALALAWVAAGRFDGYVNLTISPWDWAAGGLLVTEAGGRFEQPEGSPAPLDSGCAVVAANSALFEPLCERIRTVFPC